MGSRWWVLACLCLMGCESEAVLVVSLRTDLVPGLEVTRATTTVADASATADFALGDDLIAGTRIAAFDVPHGQQRVTVTLSGPGAESLRRTVVVDVRGGTAVTVVLTRSCRGVSCPAASDAAATECLGGVCVAPECTPETPEQCPTAECAADGECPSGPACTSPACLDGVCGLRADASECGGGACDPDEGCVGASTPDGGVPMDAGPEPDAGVIDSGALDSGTSRLDSGRGDPPRDGGGPRDCASVCPGSCEGPLCVLDGTPLQSVCPDGVDCEFRCLGFGSCDVELFCGDGACNVRCEGPSSCRSIIHCGDASTCDVRCTNSTACGTVNCGAGACDVDCTREMTCTEVQCGTGAANVECAAMGACNTVTCPAPATRLDLVCDGFGACSDVSCGADTCVIDCLGTSCTNVTCDTACNCDVACMGFGGCSSVTCPSGCMSGPGCMSAGGGGCGCT